MGKRWNFDGMNRSKRESEEWKVRMTQYECERERRAKRRRQWRDPYQERQRNGSAVREMDSSM
eukprot:1355330-Amorphochlora_amoeboformis.AAC.1